MRKAELGISRILRGAAALVVAALLAVFMCVPALSSQAYGDERWGGSSWFDDSDDRDAIVDVGFFIAEVEEGATSYPEDQSQLDGFITGNYADGIILEDAFDASDFAEFGGDLYGLEHYDLTGADIVERMLKAPTEEQIAWACAHSATKIDYDPETQTVVWYVAKSTTLATGISMACLFPRRSHRTPNRIRIPSPTLSRAPIPSPALSQTLTRNPILVPEPTRNPILVREPTQMKARILRPIRTPIRSRRPIPILMTMSIPTRIPTASSTILPTNRIPATQAMLMRVPVALPLKP